MAAITAVGTNGFVDKGVWGGVLSAITADQLAEGTHLSNREGLTLTIWHLNAVANAETLTTGLDSIVAVAWQPEDPTDDDVRMALTTQVTGILTFVAGGTRAGWVWILHRGY